MNNINIIISLISLAISFSVNFVEVEDKPKIPFKKFVVVFFFVLCVLFAIIFFVNLRSSKSKSSSEESSVSESNFSNISSAITGTSSSEDSINPSELNTSSGKYNSDDYSVTSIIDASIPVCLTSLKRVKFGCYTGNLGDSQIYVLGDTKEFRYGDVGVNGEVFKDGFEGWVARWNPVPEISWVFAIYDLDDQYNSLSVSTGLIQSYNTKDFNTTLYFFGDDVDIPLYSQVLTNEEYKYNFNVDVTGVKHLKIMLKDNVAVKGGTSFAIHNLYLT